MLISQYNLPIKVFVLNNQALGMITQFQELYFNNRLTGTAVTGGYQVPDIEKIAAAYGLKYFGITVSDLEDELLIILIILPYDSATLALDFISSK